MTSTNISVHTAATRAVIGSALVIPSRGNIVPDIEFMGIFWGSVVSISLFVALHDF